jgi:hypothetical protein
MKDEEIQLLFKTLADQQILTIRMMAHQQAHLAAIRDFLVKQGQDRTTLNQRLHSAYETALNRYHDQLSAYLETGDAKKLLDSLVFPDEPQEN